MKVVSILFTIFLLVEGLLGQNLDQAQWTRISGPQNDFTALVPSDFLVYNEGLSNRVFVNAGGATINIEIAQNPNAKSRLQQMRQFQKEPNSKYLRFTIGDFIGDSYTNDEKRYSMSFYLASAKAFYIISISAETSTNPILEKFLLSVRLGDRPMIKQNNPIENTDKLISVASLETSPIILKALKQKDARKVNIIYEGKSASTDATEKSIEPVSYSRTLIIIRKPNADFTDQGRWHGVNGTVRLKVLFRSDGQVGDIRVIAKLPDGLTKQAIDAAKKIKFLPAESAGKPVDAHATFDYTFSVY